MVWQWSHTADGIDNVRTRLELQSRRWLVTVYAEWQARICHEDEEDEFCDRKYRAARREARPLDDVALIDAVWDSMCELQYCENGGHEAWACPFGCGCHTLSFATLSGREQRRWEDMFAERKAGVP
jgi:hypothetical protein